MAVVRVSRSGGFAGRTVSGELDLDGDDPRAPEARDLVATLAAAPPPGGLPQPDRYVYALELPGRSPLRVPEQHVTPELRRLAELLLDPAS